MDLERTVTKNTRNIKTIGEAIQLLTILTSSHTDQLERTLFGIDGLRGAQLETQEKINALIDSQIRSEDAAQQVQTEIRELARLVKAAHLRIEKFEEN